MAINKLMAVTMLTLVTETRMPTEMLFPLFDTYKARVGGGTSSVVWGNSKQAQTGIIRMSDRSVFY